MKLDSYLKPYMKINSKYIIKLNELATTVKLLEENMGVNHLDLGLGNDFFQIHKWQKKT